MEVQVEDGSKSSEVLTSQIQSENFVDNGWASFPEVARKEEVKRKQNPEDRANFLSRLTFWWFNWIISTGYKRPLEDKDLWALRRDNQATYIVSKLKNKWIEQQRKCRRINSARRSHKDEDGYNESDRLLDDDNGPDENVENASTRKKENKPSLRKTLGSLFGFKFALAVFCKLLHDALIFVQPQLLKLLVGYTEDKDDMFGPWKEWKGYAYAGAMFGVAIIQSLALHQYFHIMIQIGMRMRTGIIGLVYEKALVLNSKAKGKTTAGELVNLMSVDAQRLMELMTYINSLWSSPLQIAGALYFLYSTLGISILAGLGVMVLIIPLNMLFGSRMGTLQVKQMNEKDERIKLMNEILSGIKVLKLYAWEESFMKEVERKRKKELKYLRNSDFWAAGFMFTFGCAPTLVAVTTFAIYVFTGHLLSATKAFVALALFNVMRFPLVMLPDVIVSCVQASVSLKRLQDFLNLEELDLNSVQRTTLSSSAVSIENGTFTWSTKAAPVLKEVSLQIPSGSLVAIVGQVGCGKSSLLSALLGDTEKVEGIVSVEGSVAYVAQQAWIQNATLRENILFSKAMDSARYESVLDSCALRPDLEILPNGDSTEIGERGINLSGGQKQRVSLARAVYFNADIYLLDDPLSAVDSHVGKHIFENVVGPQGMLRNKTRLLVTHGIHFLPQMDQIIVLKDGRITEVCLLFPSCMYTKSTPSFPVLFDRLTHGDPAAHPRDSQSVPRRANSNFSSLIFFPICTTDFASPINRNCSVGQRQLVCLARALLRKSKILVLDEATAAVDLETDELIQQTIRREFADRTVFTIAHRLNTIMDYDRTCERISDLKRPPSKELVTTTFSSSKASTSNKKDVSQKIENEDKDELGKMIEEERSETGRVKFAVFFSYLKSVGCCASFLTILSLFLMEACSVGTGIWLARWSSANVTTDEQRDFYLGIYGGLGLGQGFFNFLVSIFFTIGAIKASRRLHRNLLVNIMHSPMSFFDTTPVGRIVNRFSKDLYIIDVTIPQCVTNFFWCSLEIIGMIVAISYATPLFLATLPVCAIFYFYIQRVYVATSRQLQRIESVSRSPIYSHFLETVNGASTIRAFSQQRRFILDNYYKTDENQVAYYSTVSSNSWLAVRLEFLGNCLILLAGLFAVFSRDKIISGLVGMSLTYSLEITETLNWAVRMTSELETQLVSVERVKEYSETDTEARWIIPENRPPDDWPFTGRIVMEQFDLRYREGLPLVLKQISCDIKPGEKVGIVGRTGAGKSSLALALFRILERAGGKITIDGVDIATLGLQDLRSRITIIPQDPVLFSGDLRLNLDPFSKFTDDQLWHVLEVSHLKNFVSGLSEGLQYTIAEGGENLSVGQRQLVCLARALLRKSKILVLDEATAAVDLETDELIQQTIRREFADRTVFTIAHRLNTIMDYDRVLVLDSGSIAEFDSPANLISRNGLFAKLVQDAKLS
ncbi:multidrug resistance-associated protein 1-like [Stylophora pistillata]|uniref:multidrug resistance-associated protein 1-like n=1 Tax=Stylophora pistillata TaxID=50429 RepID=UPI000C03D684|nr:multidrug resistance-associated protein 1-like [Stylophora pistillata]